MKAHVTDNKNLVLEKYKVNLRTVQVPRVTILKICR